MPTPNSAAAFFARMILASLLREFESGLAQQPSIAQPPTITQPPGTQQGNLPPVCVGGDAGWSPFNQESRCFRVVTGPMSQPQAQDTCRQMGGELASVHNLQTHNFIGTLTEPIYQMSFRLNWPILRAFWIGMQRMPNSTGMYSCTWTDGSTPNDYACPPQQNPTHGDPNDGASVFPWAPGQPWGMPDEQCVHTYALYSYDSKTSPPLPSSPPTTWFNRWNDIICGTQLMGAVCAKKCTNQGCTFMTITYPQPVQLPQPQPQTQPQPPTQPQPQPQSPSVGIQ